MAELNLRAGELCCALGGTDPMRRKCCVTCHSQLQPSASVAWASLLSRSRAALSSAWRASNSLSRASCSKGRFARALSSPLLFVRGSTIEGAQGVLYALHGADGIVGV